MHTEDTLINSSFYEPKKMSQNEENFKLFPFFQENAGNTTKEMEANVARKESGMITKFMTKPMEAKKAGLISMWHKDRFFGGMDNQVLNERGEG